MAEFSSEISGQLSNSTEVQGSVETFNTNKISSIISTQRGATDENIRLNAERDLRAQITTEQKEIEKTAISSSRTNFTNVRSEQNIESSMRLMPTTEGPGSGLKSGRTRSSVEDTDNLSQRLNIENITISSAQNSSDINRARIKLQRRCNHIFNTATQICQFCQKHRANHV